jgi:WD40 repeat protein/serine/threonine protein kinase/tetratricopeptide (TPR) repeat protein
MMSEDSSGFDPVEELADAFLARYRRGERPSLNEYAEQHPELAERIRSLFPALVVMEELGSQGGRAPATQDGRTVRSTALPQRLGDFLLLRPLGSGGMGLVYEAIQESLGRHVALKMLPGHYFADPTRLERFRREARAAARLHHTHIVPVFGVGEQEGLHYYTMQFIRGHGLDTILSEVRRLRGEPRIPAEAKVEGMARQDLPTTLARRLCTGQLPGRDEGDGGPTAPQPDDSALNPSIPGLPCTGASTPGWEISSQTENQYVRSVTQIGAQVAEALEYAHQQGILHRDIKPSNLLLDAQGEVWVTDFGLAKAQDSDELTRTGDIVGTLRYMAPERFNGWSDPRSDVYALGATLYEMLALRPAFDEPDRVKLIDLVVHDAPTALRQLDRRIPHDLETIVFKALAKEPADRYATAGLLAEDLRRFLAGKPILARRSTSIERLWRWSRRNPALAGASVTVAAALVIVAVGSVAYATKQDRANRQITSLATTLKSSLKESNRLLAIRNFDRGQAAFEKDQIGAGLLWMVESWRSAIEAGDPDWQHVARANLAAWQLHHRQLKGVLSHEGPVQTAAFSPDGKTVASGGDDRTARLWDVATSLPIGHPMRHDGQVVSVAFSPGGKAVVTGSLDNTARLWDAGTGSPIKPPLHHPAHVLAVTFSPDGKTILTGCKDGRARLWDVATGQLIGRPLLHPTDVKSVAFSPDGKTILTGSYEGWRLWDAATCQPLPRVVQKQGYGNAVALGPECDVNAVAFSPDGRTFLVNTEGASLEGSRSPGLQIWDSATGQPLRAKLPRPRQSVRGVAFCPDGRTFVTGNTDNSARLWDVATYQPVGLPILHQGYVMAVAYTSDSKTLLTASSDGTARLWDADPGQPVGEILGGLDTTMAGFSREGKWLVRREGFDSIQLCDSSTGAPHGKPVRIPPVHHVGAISPDGQSICSCLGGSFRLWSGITGTPIDFTLIHPHEPSDWIIQPRSIDAVMFSPESKTLVTGVQSHSLAFWDSATGAQIGGFLPQPGRVGGGAFSADGRTFVIGYDTGLAQLWDLPSRVPLGKPFPHPGAVTAVVFTPDGQALLTGCDDGKTRLWDVATRTLLIPPLPVGAQAAAFSPDGKTVVIGTDSMAQLWDEVTGMPLGPPLPHFRGVWQVASSPDGKRYFTRPDDTSLTAELRVMRAAPELPEDLDRVSAWVEVLTGLTLDKRQGAIQVLDNQAWRARRARLDELGGPLGVGIEQRLDSILFGPNPTARGQASAELGQWEAAEAAFDEAVRARPNNADVWRERSRFHRTRKEWGKAASDKARLFWLSGDFPHYHNYQALSSLAQGDQAGLRRECSTLLDRFGTMSDPVVANSVAWPCVLAPDAVADPAAPVRLAEFALKNVDETQMLKHFCLNTLGAALYRAGRCEQAILRLEEGIRERGGESIPEDWVFLALSHHRLGHRAESRRWLDLLRARWSSEGASGWGDEVRFLLSEAEAVILYDPVFPDEPFAP